MTDPIRGLEANTKKRKIDEDDDVPTKKQRFDNVLEENSYAGTSRMTNMEEELCEYLSYEGNASHSHLFYTDEDQNEISNIPSTVSDDIISISSTESVSTDNEIETDTESTSSGYVTGTYDSKTDEDRYESSSSSSSSSNDETIYLSSTENESYDSISISSVESMNSDFVTEKIDSTTDEDQNELSDDDVIYISYTKRV